MLRGAVESVEALPRMGGVEGVPSRVCTAGELDDCLCRPLLAMTTEGIQLASSNSSSCDLLLTLACTEHGS